jgi:hypothetical protein
MTMCTPPTKATSSPVHTTTNTTAAAKLEQDKACKEKHRNSAPWSPEIWQAAPAAYLAGEAEPERRFPVIITGSTGPLPTRQKLQEIAGLPLLPAVQWTTVTSIFDDEDDHGVGMEGGPAGTTTGGEQSTPKIDKKKQKEECKEPPKEVQYCHVNWEQLQRVKACSDGEKTVVWFQEMKRYAWLARSLRLEGNGERNAEGEREGEGLVQGVKP